MKCDVCDSTKNVQVCEACLTTKYCSRECQRRDWFFEDHDLVCLINQDYVKRKPDDDDDDDDDPSKKKPKIALSESDIQNHAGKL